MGIASGAHGRARARGARPSTVALSLALTFLFLITSLACGTRSGEQKSAGSKPAGRARAVADGGAKDAGKGGKTGAARPASASATGTHRIRLSQNGCIEFEPHWTEIRVGQSLTWHSDLRKSVTVHVSPGAFGKTQFVVRAGQTVSTGPAHKAGSFSIWSDPAACQGVPSGVRGSGPGVTVEGPSSS